MSTPTKPGKYYTNCGIIEVKFVKEEGGLCTHESSGGGPGAWSGWFLVGDKRAPMQYEWGERLPSSDRLKAMREMAACDPSFDNETTDECLFCGGTANPDEPPYAIEHAADCPWLRSQEK